MAASHGATRSGGASGRRSEVLGEGSRLVSAGAEARLLERLEGKPRPSIDLYVHTEGICRLRNQVINRLRRLCLTYLTTIVDSRLTGRLNSPGWTTLIDGGHDQWQFGANKKCACAAHVKLVDVESAHGNYDIMWL